MNMDTEGTRKTVSNTADSLAKFGSKSFVILNRVEGSGFTFHNGEPSPLYQVKDDQVRRREEEVEKSVGLPVIASIPCYYDIQLHPSEFLFALKNPSHPFSKRLSRIASKIEQIG